MTTTVWLCEPRSHGRNKEVSVAGATSQCCRAPSIGVSGFVPLWARSIFSSSCVVVRAWCLEFGGAATVPNQRRGEERQLPLLCRRRRRGTGVTPARRRRSAGAAPARRRRGAAAPDDRGGVSSARRRDAAA